MMGSNPDPDTDLSCRVIMDPDPTSRVASDPDPDID